MSKTKKSTPVRLDTTPITPANGTRENGKVKRPRSKSQNRYVIAQLQETTEGRTFISTITKVLPTVGAARRLYSTMQDMAHPGMVGAVILRFRIVPVETPIDLAALAEIPNAIS